MLKINFYLIICLIFVSISCKENTRKAAEEISVPKFKNNFEKTLEGTLNSNQNIVMQLRKIDTLLSGFYYFKGQNKVFLFTGVVKNDGNFVLDEFEDDSFYAEEEEKIRQFTGQFKTDEISGFWTDKKQSLPFLLKESTRADLLSFDVISNDSCIKAFPDKKEVNAEACVSYRYFLVRTNNKELENKINNVIAENVLDSARAVNYQDLQKIKQQETNDFFTMYRQDLKDYAKDVDLSAEGDYSFMLNYSKSKNLSIVMSNPHLLTISVDTYDYLGGAHGMPGVFYINIDVKTGKSLKWTDVIAAKDTANFIKIAQVHFDKKYFKDGSYEAYGLAFEKQSDFFLTDNFVLTMEGILFTYQAYEIAAYAVGMPNFTVPYAAIKDLVLPNSAVEASIKSNHQ